MKYKHSTLEERYQIQAYKEEGFKKNEIAQKLNVHPSTIGRELNRNSSKINKRYTAKIVDKVSSDKRSYASQRSNFKMIKEEVAILKQNDYFLILNWQKYH